MIILLALLSICFAATSGPTTVASGLHQLCSTTKSTLAAFIMLSFIVSIIPLGIGAFLYFFKKESKNLKLVGIVLLVIGVLCIAGAVFGVIIYLLVPSLASSMMGNGTGVGC